MTKFALLYLLLLLLSGSTASAQSDSLRRQELRVVEVFGRPLSRYAAGSRVSSIDSLNLKLQNATQLSDLLQFRTPIYFKNYGPGSLATAAFRGTSASQTAVLWHGFNINQPTLGLSDFSIIPVNAISQVEVQYGSAGANYGSGAIGGAILLSSPATWAGGLKIRVQQDIGSFGHSFTSAGGSFNNQKINVKTTLFRQQAQNNFAFVNFTKINNPTEKQVNAATSQQGFTQDIDLKLNAANILTLRGWFTQNDNQSQPNMTQANTHARREDKSLRLLAEWNQTSGNIGNTTIRAAYFKDNMQYTDDSNNSLANINTYQAQAEHTITFREKLSLKLGTELQHFTGSNTGYAQPVNETRSAIFTWVRYNPIPKLQVSVNLRQSFIQGFNPPLTPTAGFNYDIYNTTNAQLILKGNIARGYRVPTLNDRFWPPGNANLIPESSWNYESGLQHIFKRNRFRITTEGTIYRLLVDDFIQWVPNPENGQWAPFNLKKVTSTGGEFSTEATYNLSAGRLSGGLQYSFTQSEQQKTYLPSAEPLHRQLFYVPKHSFRGFSAFTYYTWILSANLNVTGTRFTTPENNQWLEPYALLNLSGGKKIKAGKYSFEFLGKINNAFNSRYQTLQYYALPGRHYDLSFRLNFN